MSLNVKNRTIFCRDNLDVLRGINSGCIDLIYLDPPFNKKKDFVAPIGSSAEGAEFKDYFGEEDLKDEWLRDIEEDNLLLHNFLQGIKGIDKKTTRKQKTQTYCYLSYMAIRLIECHRVLKDTGSIYLHCDPTMSHYLKIVMDCIFGEKNFSNGIIWQYSTGGKSSKRFARKHDIILCYGKTSQKLFFPDNVRLAFTPHKQSKSGKNFGGKMGTDKYGRRYVEKWGTVKKKLYSYYLDRGKIPEDVWTDIQSLQSQAKERTGYPTQKTACFA